MKRLVLGRMVRATAGRLVLLLLRARFDGTENVPAGGAVLAGNHVSYMDPVVLWCGAPRLVHFMAKRELWESRFLRWALPRVGAFRVNRGEPDRGAIATATDLLKSGELIGVFPEGTRSSEGAEALGDAHGGAAFLALRAGVPIVPVGLAGTEKVWPRGQKFPRLRRVAVAFGRPVDPDEIGEGGRKERVQALTAMLMERIAEELERARGL
jgi:1-acyl-sn-glycerol-3-phosphate acyltransferase